MIRSILQALKRNFPRVHDLYAKGRRMARTEFKVLRQIGVRSILDGSLWRSTPWREILPMQKPQRIAIDGMHFVSVDSLVADLDASKLTYSPGGNAVYFPRRLWTRPRCVSYGLTTRKMRASSLCGTLAVSKTAAI